MIRHVVLDLDGVICRGREPLPGAVETLHELEERGCELAFLTNNSSYHREDLVEKLGVLGYSSRPEQCWGSAFICARHLAVEEPGARLFVLGTEGLVRELEEAGLTVLPDPAGASCVVVGIDWLVTYEKLRQAHQAICEGASFVTTNLDPAYTDSLETTAPGTGALVAALRTSTGVKPVVTGKPGTTGLSLIARQWGARPASMAMVGDRLETDMAAARSFGCLAVLVLTGVTTREEAATGLLRADVILDEISGLAAVLEQHSP